MLKGQGFLQQIQRNAVALISLAVAITALGYNTWRNEQTEENRNVRIAGFQLMEHIVELQTVVFYSRYDDQSETHDNNARVRGDYRDGWAHVLSIRDLSYNMPEEVRDATTKLYDTWNSGFSTIDSDSASFDRIDAAIDETKGVILKTINDLD